MDRLHDRAVNFALSVLCYNENKFIDYIPFIIPESKFKFDLHPNGEFFHGVVIDEYSGIVRCVFRGTDADNFIGKIGAWWTNFNVATGPDGIHNGFQGVAEHFQKEYGPYLSSASSSIHVGHSQGGGVGKVNAVFTAENFKNISMSSFEVYADPPSGDKHWADWVESLVKIGRLYGDRFIVPGDPIDSRIMRNDDSDLMDGVDVGITHLLPNVLGPHSNSPAGIIAHSPRMYCMAKMWEEIRKTETGDKIDEHYLESISWIMWRCVN